jgi:drug/metabolite transporter (DMT)-like permease
MAGFVEEVQRQSRRREVTGAIISTLLALQTPGFILMRSYTKSRICNARILMWSEGIKGLISVAPIIDECHMLTEKLYVALVPVAGYSIMNLMSFWALQRMPASVSIVIVQLKLLWATLFARIFLARPLLNAKSFALVVIFLGSIATTADEREHEDMAALLSSSCGAAAGGVDAAAGGAGDVGGTEGGLTVHMVDLVAVAVLVGETALSGFMSVYMQQIFENGDRIMWRRNTQIAALSVPFYYFSEPFMPGNEGCAATGLLPDTPGWLLALMNAVGGLLVALSILYSGAVGKTVATSAAIPLTVLSESALIAHRSPTLVQIVLSLSVMNGVLMFGVLKV